MISPSLLAQIDEVIEARRGGAAWFGRKRIP
jgi:hypothetical protein